MTWLWGSYLGNLDSLAGCVTGHSFWRGGLSIRLEGRLIRFRRNGPACCLLFMAAAGLRLGNMIALLLYGSII